MIDQAQPKQQYALFVDNSGSVGNCQSYWQTISEILVLYAKDITSYYFWNSYVVPSNKKELQDSIVSKRGTGGTSPSEVAKKITQTKYEYIILVTDGQVGQHDVNQCDKIFETSFKANKFHIKKVICYVIGSHREPNLSVTCPFTRMSESKVFSRMGNNPLKTIMQYTAQDCKVLDTLADISLQNFQAKYSTIEQLIIAKNMGRAQNPQMKDQLILLKKRLVQQLSKKLGKKGYSQQIREKLVQKKLNQALEMMENLTEKYFQESGTGDLQNKINYLISLCGDLRGQYRVDQIKSNKMKTATQAVQGEISKDVNLGQLSDNIIECPIILDEDVPQILIDQCQPFLLGLDKVLVDDINACPLRILNYPDLRLKLKSKLSTYTGVKFSDRLFKNPFTQNRLLGAIPLGKHKSHVTVGNNTIAKLISGGKVMGNLNLYFAVIWILANQDKIEYLQPIKKNIDEHLLYRLTTSNTMASLCGLSQFVSTQVSTDIAVWYCLNSAYFNFPTQKDTFRFHLFQIPYLIKIIQFLDYPIHIGIKAHYLRTRALYYLLEKYKRIDVDQRKIFITLVRGLYQKGFFINTKFSEKFKKVELCTQFIPVDGAADEQQIKQVRKRISKYCQGLTNAEIYHIVSLLDENKLFSDIFLSINHVIPNLPQAQINWKYGLQNFQHKIQIHPLTIRPLRNVEGQNWEERAKSAFNIENKQELFNGCKYIQQFILKHKKKPTQDELAVFYYNRYINAKKITTLPFQTKKWIHDLMSQYEPIFPEGFDIKKIISALKESKNITKRDALQTKG